MLYDITAVALGAVFGALLRWLLGLMLADTVSWFALGTLAANWFGGFLIGIAAELVGNPHWRLLLITGFLGSLTTFSGFSLEIVGMLQAQRWLRRCCTCSVPCCLLCWEFTLRSVLNKPRINIEAV